MEKGNKKKLVAIPSRGRAEKLSGDSEGVLRLLSPELDIHIFVRQEEYDTYCNEILCVRPDVTIVPVPDTINTLTYKREYIMKWAIERGYEVLIQLDDDLIITARDMEAEIELVEKEKRYLIIGGLMQYEDSVKMVNALTDKCSEEYVMVGVRSREFAHTVKEPVTELTRITRIWALHLPTLEKENYSFITHGELCMEDYYTNLTLLYMGYKTCILNSWLHAGPSQSPGGCAVYRTADMHSEGAKTLYKLFPEAVRLEWQRNDSWKEWRISTYPNWKKAYKIGVTRRDN